MTSQEKIPTISRNADWFSPITPYEFQWECYEQTIPHIKHCAEPGFIYASVSAGKTLMQAMVAKHAQVIAEQTNRQQMKMLFMARTGELVEQNAEEMWSIGARNSIFSASVGIKSKKYPVIVGSEGTIWRALHTELKDVVFSVLAIDECHQLPFDNEESQGMKIIAELYRRNPKLRIIGYTGSPWRGTEPILGSFWKKQLYKIDMWDLVEKGFVHQPIFGFGHDDVQYDLSGIDPTGLDGTEDFTAKQLRDMQKRILSSGTTTEKIMLEVMALTKDRNCILITCAGSKHISECAAVLPHGSYATITEKTTYAERKIIKDGCNTGKIKYVLQIGCWTVGVNIPPIDTIVILRKIGSLTLLTQLIGRGIRLLKKSHIDLGMTKLDCLVLDYSGTMESIGHLFNDPLIEAAELARAKRKNEIIYCPRCNTENSKFARRCINTTGEKLDKDGRCGFFWSSKVCEKCGTENDKVARSCRECDHALIDPNANLSGKHYTDDDYKNVIKGSIFISKDRRKIVAQYQLDDGSVAKEVFDPASREHWIRAKWTKFFKDHCPQQYAITRGLSDRTTILGLANHLPMFDIPTQITHRINDSGFSIIAKKRFGSGREIKD